MSGEAASPARGERLAREVTIRNVKGLHARASAKFVRCAEVYDAQVTVAKDGQNVAATSIMGLMMLAAGPGSVLRLEAEGPEAADALDAIAALVDGRFDED